MDKKKVNTWDFPIRKKKHQKLMLLRKPIAYESPSALCARIWKRQLKRIHITIKPTWVISEKKK